ncbi:MAG: aromatic ring-cleaving dioxygenase [Myxococcota bacterium]|jgi:aromatic ring-cleaving dioxygenase
MSASFHVHVYWSIPAQRAEAMRLREAAAARFPGIVAGRIHEAPFAFHPAPIHVLGFLGLKDVRFIEADGLMMDAEGRLASARAQIAEQLARPAA